ncbi:MAG: hypothetical protein GX589_08340 [Deltaproteobacteria bacterium]|nr:hypothetical protein [Deltaproteobacteria bacterium]
MFGKEAAQEVSAGIADLLIRELQYWADHSDAASLPCPAMYFSGNWSRLDSRDLQRVFEKIYSLFKVESTLCEMNATGILAFSLRVYQPAFKEQAVKPLRFNECLSPTPFFILPIRPQAQPNETPAAGARSSGQTRPGILCESHGS